MTTLESKEKVSNPKHCPLLWKKIEIIKCCIFHFHWKPHHQISDIRHTESQNFVSCFILMAWHHPAVTPLIMHWSHCSLALNQQIIILRIWDVPLLVFCRYVGSEGPASDPQWSLGQATTGLVGQPTGEGSQCHWLHTDRARHPYGKPAGDPYAHIPGR